jgi:TP901 family phage tail tape measure protein
MANRIQRTLALLITGEDVSATKTLRGVTREVNSVSSISAKAGKNLGRNLERGAIVAGAAAVGMGVAVTNAAMDFESSAASVAKTVPGAIDEILEANRKLARETGESVDGLNEIAATAGALDVPKDEIDDFTRVVAMLGQTTDDLPSDVAAPILGHLNTTLQIDDWDRFGNTLVHLGNNGASTEGDIANMTEAIAGAAGIMNASEAQVLGWAAAVANTGEEAEAGGSSIQRFWLESFKNVEAGGKELKLMAKISGQTVAQFKRDFGTDATGTLAKFVGKLGELTEAEQLATLEALGFTDIRITRALLKLTQNTDNLTGSLAEAEKGWAENKAGTEEWQKRLDTTASKLAIFRANVHDAAITIGSELLPVIADLSQEGVAWIEDHQGDIQEFAKDLGSGVREAVQWAQKLDWEAIGAALGLAGQGARMVVDAFTSLPPWIQTAVLTGWGLNKLTGGAVIDFGKLAFDQFAGRGSSPANPVWVAGAGLGGKGGALPAGGGAGLAGKLGGAISVAAIVAGVAGVIQTQQEQSGASTAHAAEIKAGLDSSIAGKTLPELKSALAAVDSGISRLESNPLHALVQGEALTTLQTMRADLNAQIAKEEGHASAALQAQRRGEQKAEAGTQRVIATTRAKLDAANRTMAAAGLKAQRAGERVASEVRAKDLSVTTNTVTNVAVSTKVSVAGIRTGSTYSRRYAQTGTSQSGNVGGKVVGNPHL